MSNTAFREDLNNEKQYSLLPEVSKTKKAIDFLYVLTYADLQAVGQNIYSSFNALKRALSQSDAEALQFRAY